MYNVARCPANNPQRDKLLTNAVMKGMKVDTFALCLGKFHHCQLGRCRPDLLAELWMSPMPFTFIEVGYVLHHVSTGSLRRGAAIFVG